jgi:hypothetical protein
MPGGVAMRCSIGLLALLGLVPTGAGAQEPAAAPPGRRQFVVFPAGDIVPVYVADPHRPNNVLEERFHTHTEIAETAGLRTALAAGGRFGILRIDPPTRAGRAWQVSIDAGLDAVFDSKHKLDAVGWDGNYGLSVTTASESPWSLRFALQHLSAHLGDEYQDRTGRRRLNYTREEIAAGAVRRFGPRWRAYGEIGGAYKTRSDIRDPWRIQGGIEHEGARRFFRNEFTWYAAADLQSMQERNWRMDVAVEAGMVKWTSARAYRIGASYVDGRPTLGEFTDLSERFLSLFLKVDM